MTVINSPSDANVTALENQFGLADRIVDEGALTNSVDRFRERGILLPRFSELADPSTFDHGAKVGDADPQGPDARNLWRVHWYNDLSGNRVQVPDHVVLPSELTGVPSPIIVVFGDRFPMITAHKVLAAYSCLAPRVVTGQFDPTVHRAVDRQLRPRWDRHQQDHGEPRRSHSSRGNESGTLRLARRVVRQPGGRCHQDIRNRIECQRDLRRLQRVSEGSRQFHPQPVL